MSWKRLINDIPREKKVRWGLGALVVCLGIIGLAISLSSLKRSNQPRSDSPGLRQQLNALLEQKRALSQIEQAISSREPTATDSNSAVLTPESVASRQKGELSARGSADRDSTRFPDFSRSDAFQKVVPRGEDIYIPTGAVFQAKLLTPIKTSIQESFVLAETTHEFRMDRQRHIGKSWRLIGRARLNPLLRGVVLEFYRIVDSQGKEHPIQGLALSRNALPQLEGLYFSDDLERYSTALAFGFLGGFSEAAQERTPTIYGEIRRQDLNNRVLNGLSTASFQIAEDILRDIRERAVEYIVVPAGENIFVALTSRFILAPENTSLREETR